MKHYTKLFRQHDVVPDVAASTIYRELTTDWVRLHGMASSGRTIRRWARAEPALEGLATPGAVVDAVDAADNGRKDDLLGALVRLFHDKQDLAGRIVLQAMLPKLARIALSAVPESGNQASFVEESRHETLAEFWDVLASYPIQRRPQSVAGGLALDTLNRVVRSRKQHHQAQTLEYVPVEPAEFAQVVPPGERSSRISHLLYDRAVSSLHYSERTPGSIDPNSELIDVIVWGVRNNTISLDDGQMLLDVYVPGKGTGWGFTDVAERRGWSADRVRQRCLRATRRLTDAVRIELATGIDLDLGGDASATAA
jgi:hypothetical protein